MTGTVKQENYSANQNLRILWEKATDGLKWQNIIKSSDSSTNLGVDVAVINLKSDIVEQVWRANQILSFANSLTPKTCVWVVFDAGGADNGIDSRTCAVEMFALLNHNLSKEATISVYGYGPESTSAFTTENVIIDAPYTERDTPQQQGYLIAKFTVQQHIDSFNLSEYDNNIIWSYGDPNFLADALPTYPYQDTINKSFRYFMLVIEDPKKTDQQYIEVGRFIGGQPLIMIEENFSANVEYQEVSFKDEVQLNGFTSIANSRALKKTLKLTFEHLNSRKTNNFTLDTGDTRSAINHKALRKFSGYCRDTIKSLVVPQINNRYLFYAYGKLTEMPVEGFDYVDEESIYVDMTLNWDEAR